MSRQGSLLILIALITACSHAPRVPAPVENIMVGKNYTEDTRSSYTGTVYTVKETETLYSIAWQTGKDYSELAKLNKLSAPFQIFPGQVLVLTPPPVAIDKPTTQVAMAKLDKPNDFKPIPVNKRPKSKFKPAVRPKPVKNLNRTSVPVKTVATTKTPQYYSTSRQQVVNNVVHRQESQKQNVRPQKATFDGSWTWPVKGELLEGFSYKADGVKGIRIQADRGQSIKAAAAGTVVYAGNALRGYGNLVIIKHSDKYLSAYAHSDRIVVKEKQNVLQGQKIAEVGSSGINRVMAHFEIRKNGKPVDPIKLLP
ncbi:peptidoglycan DD-metalloendopeptidase family protein [Paraferrimonas sp. SM1919]|uniref:peptidoglycan DD-metalloendopeptidase family protein n=1 Tax=Paraferrimonas sp. SM1919 TaxID=2662263 RepID=UPI0013D57044|nr:peptidoglycan DD-metalloendopeptidase family protein [Paraferrimonas sp. SM1919]